MHLPAPLTNEEIGRLSMNAYIPAVFRRLCLLCSFKQEDARNDYTIRTLGKLPQTSQCNNNPFILTN